MVRVTYPSDVLYQGLYDSAQKDESQQKLTDMQTKENRCFCSIITPKMESRIAAYNGSNQDLQRHEISLGNMGISQQFRNHRILFGKQNDKMEDTAEISVFTSKHKENIQLKLLKSTEKTSKLKNTEAERVFKASQTFFEGYKTLYNWSSINNKNMPMVSVIDYGHKYANAFWDGKRMCYGDGDGDVFNDFTLCPDIGYHEQAHGVTDYSRKGTGLTYKGESGAANEAFSDIEASILKQWESKQTVKEADWLIGTSRSGNLVKDYKGHQYALRSMKEPGTAYLNHPILGDDDQPGTMGKYLQTKEDNGGVHTNSGILNKAFYESCLNVSRIDDREGKNQYAYETAGKLWMYPYLHDTSIKADATFADIAKAISSRVVQLYGDKSSITDAFRKSFQTTEILGMLTSKPF